jgi:hypothetical protein
MSRPNRAASLSVSHSSGLHDSAYRDAEPTRRSKPRILPVVHQAKRESRLPPVASLHHDQRYCGREPFYLVWPSECRKQISLCSWLASMNLSLAVPMIIVAGRARLARWVQDDDVGGLHLMAIRSNEFFAGPRNAWSGLRLTFQVPFYPWGMSHVPPAG